MATGAQSGEPDVILDLAGSPPPPALLGAARFGVWTFLYGADGRFGDVGVRELLADERAVVVRLVRLAGPRTAVVLEEGAFKAVPHSLAATRRRVLGTISAWPALQVRRLLSGVAPADGGTQVRIRPGHGMASLAARMTLPLAEARNLARRIAREAIEERWTLGIVDKPVQHVLDRFDRQAVRWLPELADGYLADPFGIVRDGRLTVVAEAYRFGERHGCIVALEGQPGGTLSAPREVLRLPVHASYPQLIAHGGQIYCLPEAGRAGRVQLFRAAHFPDRWHADRVLIEDFAGADATAFEHEGHWWLLAGDHADQDDTKLFAFYAPDLFGPWSPHPLNPVKCDLRSARPAGPPFTHHGCLYRPAQDCSTSYGGAIALNRMVRLTPDDFAEETVAVLRPDRGGAYPDGLHTLVGVGGITLVDGKRHTVSPARLPVGLRRLWRELRRGDGG